MVVEVVDGVELEELELAGAVVVEVVDVVETEGWGVVVDVVVVDVVDPSDVLLPGGADCADAPADHSGAMRRTRSPTAIVATKDRTRMVPNISAPKEVPHEQ